MFVRNTWYVAGFGHEVEPGKLLSRTFLGERVVMYRTADGSPKALRDRCPHRFVPLHIGKVVGDEVQCGYHGLQFGADGGCTHNPHGDGLISPNMKVRAYPLAERDGLLWIWMGEVAKADPAAIADFSLLVDPAYKAVSGYMRVEASYQLVNDNLLDLSHAEYVHPIFQNSEREAPRHPPELSSGEEGNSLWSKVIMRDTLPTPFMALHCDWPRVTSWIDTYWHAPSNMFLDIGSHVPQDTREGEVFHMPSWHLLTPETEGSTHYFWAMSRNVRHEDEELSRKVYAGIDQAFSYEDKPIIEMQQRELGVDDLMAWRPVLLRTDATAVRARRIIEGMLEHDAGERAAAE